MPLEPLEIHKISHYSFEETLARLRHLESEDIFSNGYKRIMVELQETGYGKARFTVKQFIQQNRYSYVAIFNGIAEYDPQRKVTIVAGGIFSSDLWINIFFAIVFISFLIFMGIAVIAGGDSDSISGFMFLFLVCLFLIYMGVATSRNRLVNLVSKIRQAI